MGKESSVYREKAAAPVLVSDPIRGRTLQEGLISGLEF